MTSPKTPQHIKPIRSLNTQELIERLKMIERDRRTGLLVDYLHDMWSETLWVMDELAALDFDPVEYLRLLIDARNNDDRNDDYHGDHDDDDGDDDDWAGPELVH